MRGSERFVRVCECGHDEHDGEVCDGLFHAPKYSPEPYVVCGCDLRGPWSEEDAADHKADMTREER